jgi:hypothetical protein
VNRENGIGSHDRHGSILPVIPPSYKRPSTPVGCVVVGRYESFFIASAGASAAIVALLANTQSAALQRALVLVVVALYGSALGRAWVVTGITRR